MSFITLWGNLVGRLLGATNKDDVSRSGPRDTPEDAPVEAEAAPPQPTSASAEGELDPRLAEHERDDGLEEESRRVAREMTFAPPPSPPKKKAEDV